MSKKDITIATLGSHSALDICRGAKDEGFRTLVVSQFGREKTYDRYYTTRGAEGCVDECLVVERFSDILTSAVQDTLRRKRCVFVPHRSFEVYCNFDYQAIEKRFDIPIFGNKFLLKFEERSRHPNQYDLLASASIRFPVQFRSSSLIDRLVIVKVSEKQRPWERAFFLAHDPASFKRASHVMLKAGKITKKALSQAVIEEYAVGVPVNFHFFYSPLKERLELMGTDTRRQTNIEGITRLPAVFQEATLRAASVTFEEAGHSAVTVLESMLEDAFAIGERFVTSAREMMPPGVIGPFALQAVITSGPSKKEIIVIDVSPRMPGSPGIAVTPYSGYLYDKPVSMGRRVAIEIKEAMRDNALDKIVT